jgi:hypothetical protein
MLNAIPRALDLNGQAREDKGGARAIGALAVASRP